MRLLAVSSKMRHLRLITLIGFSTRSGTNRPYRDRCLKVLEQELSYKCVDVEK